jgi:3-hydroxybutyryl-CoA dehydrogenase
MMNIRTIGVVGAGTMGNGIAQVFAQAGYGVRLVDVAQPMLDRARNSIDRSLAKFVEKGKLSAADRDATLARLTTYPGLDALAEADYIVEAIVENADAKRELFARLDALAGRTSSFRRTRRQSRSRCSALPRSGPTGSSACTS